MTDYAFPAEKPSYRMGADIDGNTFEIASHHVGLSKREYFGIRILEALIISGGTTEILDKARMALQVSDVFMEECG